MKTNIMKGLLIALVVAMTFIGMTSMTETIYQTNSDIKITDLNLNRKAVKLTGDKKKEFPKTDIGFLWNSSDSKTKNWRPQGITGMTDAASGREFVLVSWYGRPKYTKEKVAGVEVKVATGASENYKNRGARISIVDITKLASNPSEPNYRNVLLVDENHDTYYDMHAGGIVAINGKLHVADSRSDHRVIRVFDLNKIQYLPESKAVKKYRYVMVEEYNYKSPIKPSFISYDKDNSKILVGTFAKEPSDAKPNLMAWFTPPAAANATTFTQNISQIDVYRLPNKYKKIQGMVASKDANGKQILWLSTSFGRSARSNFYKMNIDINASTPKYTTATPNNIITTTNSSGAKYPPGLEDAYLTANNELWLLTEFAYNEGKYAKLSDPKGSKLLVKTTRRGVFRIKKSDILPN